MKKAIIAIAFMLAFTLTVFAQKPRPETGSGWHAKWVEWSEVSKMDGKVTRFWALPPLQIKPSDPSSALTLYCEGREAFVAIIPSDVVNSYSFSGNRLTHLRIRFDKEPIESPLATEDYFVFAGKRTAAIRILGDKNSETFVLNLTRFSRLLVEIDTISYGNKVIEFDVSGAAPAVQAFNACRGGK